MSKPSKYGERHLRFCPKCGIERLLRDYFPGEFPGAIGSKQPKVGTEFLCESCGFSFWISKSRRVLFAELKFSQDRKRAPVKFTEACVGTEVAELYLKSVDPPALGSLKKKLIRKLKSLTNFRQGNCTSEASSGVGGVRDNESV